jgi:exonuclease VII small subunit
MKNLLLFLSVLLLSALLLSSCGKSSEQKQMESTLNEQVMAMHDTQMMKMKEMQRLDEQLDSAILLNDSLRASFPRETEGYTNDNLTDAKRKLSAARGAMESWMSGFKPYDEEMKHEEAMAQLNTTLQDLTRVGVQLEEAITDATGTIAAHQQAAAELLAKKKPATRSRR